MSKGSGSTSDSARDVPKGPDLPAYFFRSKDDQEISVGIKVSLSLTKHQSLSVHQQALPRKLPTICHRVNTMVRLIAVLLLASFALAACAENRKLLADGKRHVSTPSLSPWQGERLTFS